MRFRYGDKGEDVQRMQQTLVDWGYELRYGADGHLGDETWLALQTFSRAELNAWAPEVPEGTVSALLQDVPVPAPDPGPVPDPESVVEVIDLRSEQSDPAPKSKVSGGRTVLRAPRNVTGIVLHQTATNYGVSEHQVRAAGGDADLALQRRALNVACHAMAFRKGWVVLANDLRAYSYHANSLCAVGLGLEVEGSYPGLLNAPTATTWGGGPTELTQETIEAAREGIRTLTEKGRAMGMPIEYLWAHRQSAGRSRRSDPGEGLWRAVVLDYAVPVLGLKTQPRRTFGDGLPIPLEWDPDGKGSY